MTPCQTPTDLAGLRRKRVCAHPGTVTVVTLAHRLLRCERPWRFWGAPQLPSLHGRARAGVPTTTPSTRPPTSTRSIASTRRPRRRRRCRAPRARRCEGQEREGRKVNGGGDRRGRDERHIRCVNTCRREVLTHDQQLWEQVLIYNHDQQLLRLVLTFECINSVC